MKIAIAVAVLIGVVFLAAVLRGRRARPATEPTEAELNAYMAEQAMEAVHLAREAHSTSLDFSPESIESVEAILSSLHEQRAYAEFSREHLRAAIIWGAYIGEVIRRREGGTWKKEITIDGDTLDFPLAWKEHHSFPISWAKKRIGLGPDENVWVKFAYLVQGPESPSAGEELVVGPE